MYKGYFIFLFLFLKIYGDSLKDLLESANVQNNIIISKELSSKAKLKEYEASRSAMFPTLDAGGFFQSVDDKTLMQPGDVYSGYVKLSYDIMNGGRKSSIKKQKLEELKSTKFEADAFKKSLVLQIVQDFFNIKNLKAMINSLKEKQIALKAQLKRVKKFYDVNLSTKDDVNKLQSAYDMNSYNIQSLELQKTTLLKQLELKVGKSINSLEDSRFLKNINIKLELTDEIKALKAKRKSLKYLAKSIESANLPQVNITDTYSKYKYNRYDKFHPKGLDEQNKIMLSVNLRLFDDGMISKNKQSAILNAKALENQIIYKTKEQKMLFNIAKSRIKTLKAKIKSAKSALKSALSTYKTIKSKYEAGLVDNVAYLDALSVKTEAKSRYESSLNELEIAYAIFYYYAGKDPKEFIE